MKNAQYQAPWNESEPEFYGLNDKPKNKPKVHVLATIADWVEGITEGIFSDHGITIVGRAIALTSLGIGTLGYGTIILPMAVAQLGLTLGTPIGWLLSAATAAAVQTLEIFPRRFKYFPKLADRGVFRLNRVKHQDPVQNAPKAAHLLSRWVKTADLRRLKRGEKLSWIAYFLEGALALSVVGVYFAIHHSPVLRLGALLWGGILVAGCEIGLAIADTGSVSRLTANQEQQYKFQQDAHAAKAAGDAAHNGVTIDI